MEDDNQQFAKALTEMPNILQELTLIQGIKHYFSALRHSRGHNPEGSPIDLEILVILKLISGAVENPVQTLQNLGIIIVGNQIAINANFLKIVLSTCRSRINNSMKHLGWMLSNVSNNDKFEILQRLVDRKDARNWTMRIIPSSSPVSMFLHDNPQIKLQSDHIVNDSIMPLGVMILDGSHDPNIQKEDGDVHQNVDPNNNPFQ